MGTKMTEKPSLETLISTLHNAQSIVYSVLVRDKSYAGSGKNDFYNEDAFIGALAGYEIIIGAYIDEAPSLQQDLDWIHKAASYLKNLKK